MPKQILGMTRRGVLRSAAVAAAAGAVPGRALAAPQSPAPQGDDVGFLSFGAVAEGVLANFYTQALGVKGAWSGGDRALLGAAHGRHRNNVDRINAVLGPNDAVPLDDFSRVVEVGTRAGALKVGRSLEELAAGVYLNGAGYASDAGTRIMLGRLLAAGHAQGAMLARLAGHAAAGLPSPVDLDAAGLKLDAYLKDPNA
jgi:hypothetical protein